MSRTILPPRLSPPRWVATLALLVTAAGCRAPRPADVAPDALSDANIAAIVVAANNADILYADLALAKSQDAAVREFATMVKKDHESVNEVAIALVTRIGVTPVDNELSFDIRDDGQTKRLILRDFEGFAFDSAYAVNEVAYHESVISTLDETLVPAAQHADLKALLMNVRPAFVAHLEHARRLAARKATR